MGKFDGISFYGHEDEELQKEYKRLFCNMTQEEKQLLIKDLCGRLPYGVKYQDRIEGGVHILTLGTISHYERFIPYLRPMSSMTEEEEFHYKHLDLLNYSNDGFEMPNFRSIDWLLAHHFDFRGLIEKGLALEASEEMYKDIHTDLI